MVLKDESERFEATKEKKNKMKNKEFEENSIDDFKL